jgi:hypothetical protein
MSEYGTLKSVEVILKRGKRRENNEGNETNRNVIYIYMEKSQQNPMYNDHILVK